MPEQRSVPAAVLAQARGAGALVAGHYRVVILAPDASLTHHDFATLGEARGYAFDWCHETEDDRGPALAYVFDAELRRVD